MTNKQQIVVGNHVLSILLRQYSQLILKFCCDASKQKQHEKLLITAQKQGINVEIWQTNKIKKFAPEAQQGLFALTKDIPTYNENDLKINLAKITLAKSLWLVLDDIQDPHNLGACLRTAAALNVQGVIIAKNSTAKLTTTVIKTSSGGAFLVKTYIVKNLARTLEMLKQHDIWLYGATLAQDAHNIYTTKAMPHSAIIMGAEGKGIHQQIQNKCDFLIKMPMMNTSIQSLNASVATGVCLYEFFRKQNILR